MGIHDETRFPNAFVRFRRLVGLVATVLWSICSAFILLLAVLDILKLGAHSPFLGCVAGIAIALVIRKAIFVKPMLTAHALRAMWLVIMIYIFIVHRSIGAPTWSSWLMFGLAGFYLAATFVFYSSKFLYIGKLISELPERSDKDDPHHEEAEEEDVVDQEVEEARRREARR